MELSNEEIDALIATLEFAETFNQFDDVMGTLLERLLTERADREYAVADPAVAP